MTPDQRRDSAAAFLENLARDDRYGYDQALRWGERGDYDCSSAVITAWERAGVPVKAAGAGYTGNMRGAFLRCGFEDVTSLVELGSGSGLLRGDVLLNVRHHTAIYCGDGREAEASINEKGGVTGGEPGDQTGREILIRPYRNYPWDCVLRYTGAAEAQPTQLVKAELPLLRRGALGPAAAACQAALYEQGFDPGGIDGDFGPRTEDALRRFQTAAGLESDGICGGESWTALMKR